MTGIIAALFAINKTSSYTGTIEYTLGVGGGGAGGIAYYNWV